MQQVSKRLNYICYCVYTYWRKLMNVKKKKNYYSTNGNLKKEEITKYHVGQVEKEVKD